MQALSVLNVIKHVLCLLYIAEVILGNVIDYFEFSFRFRNIIKYVSFPFFYRLLSFILEKEKIGNFPCIQVSK